MMMKNSDRNQKDLDLNLGSNLGSKLNSDALISKVLTDLRHDLPSDEYFSGVLSEFHSRQRNLAFERVSVWSQWMESLRDLWFFRPARLIQGAAFSLLVLFFTLNGLYQSWNSGRETLASWYKGGSVEGTALLGKSALPVHFVSSDAIDQLGSTALNRPVELASLSFVDAGTGRTQYVLNSTPAVYDSMVAF